MAPSRLGDDPQRDLTLIFDLVGLDDVEPGVAEEPSVRLCVEVTERHRRTEEVRVQLVRIVAGTQRSGEEPTGVQPPADGFQHMRVAIAAHVYQGPERHHGVEGGRPERDLRDVRTDERRVWRVHSGKAQLRRGPVEPNDPGSPSELGRDESGAAPKIQHASAIRQPLEDPIEEDSEVRASPPPRASHLRVALGDDVVASLDLTMQVLHRLSGGNAFGR